MIRRWWRTLWCRLLGHVLRPLNPDADPAHQPLWWCIRCGYFPTGVVRRHIFDAGRGVVFLEDEPPP